MSANECRPVCTGERGGREERGEKRKARLSGEERTEGRESRGEQE